ncbi:MAG: hypothetical protein U9N34_03900 [Candidatus Cloacimonadota bacterium]|nr:hypothetical protein [Candidatus Cloacimonadota bacterium]
MKSKFSILITLFFFLVGCKWTLGTDANPPIYSVDTIARQEFGGDTHFLNIKENTA